MIAVINYVSQYDAILTVYTMAVPNMCLFIAKVESALCTLCNSNFSDENRFALFLLFSIEIDYRKYCCEWFLCGVTEL